MSSGKVKLYNLLLPIWLVVFIPSFLWLLLIPANYLLDRIVLKWSLGDMQDKGLFCRNHNWKICLAGFLSDFIAAVFLFALNQIMCGIDEDSLTIIGRAADGMMFNPLSNILSFIIVCISIALAAVCIFFLDKGILIRAGIGPEQAKRPAIRLAVITAPYLYLIPSELFHK